MTLYIGLINSRRDPHQIAYCLANRVAVACPYGQAGSEPDIWEAIQGGDMESAWRKVIRGVGGS